MQPEPLVLLTPPALLTTIDPSAIVSVGFFILFVLWVVYTVVTAYHWLRYGHRSTIALPALGIHVFVSGYLAMFAVSGFTG